MVLTPQVVCLWTWATAGIESRVQFTSNCQKISSFARHHHHRLPRAQEQAPHPSIDWGVVLRYVLVILATLVQQGQLLAALLHSFWFSYLTYHAPITGSIQVHTQGSQPPLRPSPRTSHPPCVAWRKWHEQCWPLGWRCSCGFSLVTWAGPGVPGTF